MMPEMDWDSQQHPSAPSTPNSFSSQSTGNSNSARTEKVPTLKQLSPSPSVTALSKLTDEDLRRKGKEDMLMILRRMEVDYKNLLGEHGNVVKDVNRRYQIFVLESRNLKEVNQKLQDDNQELRDLCCFLDDDRQRGRKLAREWQRFGRYTASVMRSEVAVYQEKLRELEQRQSELVTENVELKELCLFLDQERTRITGDRDEGDGSSNGTTTGLEEGIVSNEMNGSSVTGSSNYLRDLELKVQRLEEEKRLLAQRINRNSAEGLEGSANDATLLHDTGQPPGMEDELLHGSGMVSLSADDKKPDAVVHAMKVLQVHEELEKAPTHDENWDDSEKAILREMCNVVWRKLGDIGGGDVGSFNESSDSILDPPPPPTNSSVSHPGALGPVPGMHGQSQSFSLQQPHPQLASTPLAPATNTKMSSSSHIIDPPPSSSMPSTAAVNQNFPESSSQPSYLPPSTKPLQSSRLPDHQNQSQTAAKKSAWPPQADQRVDMYLSSGKDQIITANARPISPIKKPDTDRIIHDNFDRGPHSNKPSHPNYPSTKPYQYSTQEDEKIPPHFLPHRRQAHPQQYPPSQLQQQQQQQRQPPPPSSTKAAAPSQHHNHPSRNAPPPSSLPSTSQPPPNHLYSNTNSINNNNNDTDSSNPHLHPLTSSQQYPPHHSIRLLDAPGVHQQQQQQQHPPHNIRQDPRPGVSDNPRPVSKDDNYSPQKPQKPPLSTHHPQMMYQRRDDTRSEPNIAQSAPGRHVGSKGGGGGPLNQPARGPSRTGMDRQQDGYGGAADQSQPYHHHHHHHQPHHHGRFASDSSQAYQSMLSIPSSSSSSRPSHSSGVYHQHQQDPTAPLPPSSSSSSSHRDGGSMGFSAYPPTTSSMAKAQQQQQQHYPPPGPRSSTQQQQRGAPSHMPKTQTPPVMGGRMGGGGTGQQSGWNGSAGHPPPRTPHYYDDYDDSDCL